MISFEVVTKHRQTETALPLERAVARSAVTTESPEHWQNVLLKIRNLTSVFQTLTDRNINVSFSPLVGVWLQRCRVL